MDRKEKDLRVLLDFMLMLVLIMMLCFFFLDGYNDAVFVVDHPKAVSSIFILH